MHTPKLTTLSLHRAVCALPISPCCYKGAESIPLPGVQLPGLRASSPPAQPGQPRRSRGVRPSQVACRVAVAVAPTASCPHHDGTSLEAMGSVLTPLPSPSSSTVTLSHCREADSLMGVLQQPVNLLCYVISPLFYYRIKKIKLLRMSVSNCNSFP